MFFPRMCSLVLLEVAFPRVGFCTIRKSTMVFFSRVFGAFLMAIKVAFPLRFIEAFAAIESGTIGAELNEGRVASASCRRSRSHGALSSICKGELMSTGDGATLGGPLMSLYGEGVTGVEGGTGFARCCGKGTGEGSAWITIRQSLTFTKMRSFDRRCSVFGQVDIVLLCVLINLTTI